MGPQQQAKLTTGPKLYELITIYNKKEKMATYIFLITKYNRNQIKTRLVSCLSITDLVHNNGKSAIRGHKSIVNILDPLQTCHSPTKRRATSHGKQHEGSFDSVDASEEKYI